MSQSEVMVGALIAGFVLWLLMTNRLQAYWALLTGGGTSVASAATGGSTPGAAQLSAGGTTASPVTTPGNAPTGPLPSFLPDSVQQFGNYFVWKDATSGATRISPTPPPGWTPPQPATGTGGG